MRKLLLVLIAGLALILAGCTTGTNGNGNGDQVDTQAFFPNDQDNYWQYQKSGNETNIATWTIMDDPGYQLTFDQQRLRVHDDDAHEDTYRDSFFTDNEEDTLINTGYMTYDEGDLDQNISWTSDPYTLLSWDDYGISVGDTWVAWDVSGLPTNTFGFDPPAEIDSLGFNLDAEVTGTEDFDYDGSTLTAYVIEILGVVVFEDDEEDPENWDDYPYREDYYFVPEFGWVMHQTYEEQYGNLYPSVLCTLIDTNVPIPD